jgi:general secretion pathway protein F
MRFELRAITQDGRLESVDCQALDAQSARRQAEGRGYTVLEVRSRKSLVARSGRFPLPLFSQELLVLLAAGLSLVEALETLAQKEKRAEWRAVLASLLAVLRQGQPLSSALEQAPAAFPPLYVATVRAAEKTSDLVPALTRYVSYQAQLDTIRRRVVNASIYPLLLIGVGGLVTLFLMLYVVPRFGKIYAERSADLPLFSQILIAWGELVQGHAAVVIVALAAIVVSTVVVLRQTSVRAALGNALWRVPAIGEHLKVYQLARFYRTTGMLLKGGMPLVTALGMAGELLHPVLRGKLASASRAISEGHAVSASLDANGLATPVALRMLAVGDRSGSMGEMMERIAGFHDEELARFVDWFTRLFEPLLMAAIGLVIGAIVVLMYMPIFELAGNLQ